MHSRGIFDLFWMVRHGRLLHRMRGLTPISGCVFAVLVPSTPGPEASATFIYGAWIDGGYRIGAAFSAGLQPAVCRWAMPWGCAPGYDSAGFQPA